jgi:hypothetical protein
LVSGSTFIPYAGRVFDAKEIIALVDASLDFWLTAGGTLKSLKMILLIFSV